MGAALPYVSAMGRAAGKQRRSKGRIPGDVPGAVPQGAKLQGASRNTNHEPSAFRIHVSCKSTNVVESAPSANLPPEDEGSRVHLPAEKTGFL